MKIFAAILIALLALAAWLGFLFVRYAPPVPAEQRYGAVLRSAMDGMFSSLESSSATTTVAQIQALLARAGTNSVDGKRREAAELSQALSRRLLSVHEERERCKARLAQINAATVAAKPQAAGSQAAPAKKLQPVEHLKSPGNVKRIGQGIPARTPPPSQSPPSPDKSALAAAEKERWAKYVSSARPPCEDALRKIEEMESGQ